MSNSVKDILARSVFPFEEDTQRYEHAIKWQHFLPKLISAENAPRSALISNVIGLHLSSLFDGQPYTAPFQIASENFLSAIDTKYRHVFSKPNIELIYTELAKSLISRSVEVSRYALHTSYLNANLPYSVWKDSFGDASNKNPWLGITKEFPVLIRSIFNVHENFANALSEMLKRLELDRADLQKEIGIPKKTLVSSINTNMSDPHNSGRTVMRVSFEDGRSIIYKPKSLDIEKSFSNFAKNNQDTFGVLDLKVVNRPAYGWVQDVGDNLQSAVPNSNPFSIGAASACFWLLNATDLHFENVRPTKNGVYALDLETLLAAPVRAVQNSLGPRWRHHSVNATMLFDGKVGAQKELMKIGGFDPSSVWVSPIPLVSFSIINDKVEIEVRPENSETQIFSERKDFLYEDMQDLTKGFLAATSQQAKNKLEEFVDGLDEEATLRLVPRNTIFYARILERMRQPKFLRDAKIMYSDINTLHQAIPDDYTNASAMHDLVEDEIRQLLNGDIPYFSYRPDSLDLQGAGVFVKSFFEATGKSHAIAKIQQIEESDVSEQLELIKISLDFHVKKPALHLPKEGPDIQKKFSTKGVLVAEFTKFAVNAIDSAFRPKQMPARFLSLQGDDSGENLRAGIGEEEFFGGYWGVVLALQACEKVVLDAKVKSKIRDFLASETKVLPDALNIKQEEHFGRKYLPLGFSGLGGEFFARAVLLSLNENSWSFLKLDLEENLKIARASIWRDEGLDVVGGSAGLILGCEKLLNHADLSPSLNQMVLEVQQEAAQHLMQRAKTLDGLPVWQMIGEEEGLLGYAHGWAGAITALSAVEKRVVEPAEKEKIRSFIEHSAKYPEYMLEKHGAWLDHRGGAANTKPLNNSWCNGVPGFLRGMFEVRSHLSLPAVNRADGMFKDLSKTIGLSETYRFCCGEMGAVDLLIDVNKVEDNPKTKGERARKIYKATREVLSHLNDDDHDHSHSFSPELMFNGLFQGKAGIAYTGMRLLLPQLPSLSGQSIRNLSM